MIRGLHGLIYSSQAEAMREFIRDRLKLPYTDVGQGWLIFDLPEGDLGVHPTDESGEPPSGTHDVSLYCDDIQGTVADLESRGVTFTGPPQDHGYGWVTYFTMPGDVRVQLYEPKYTKGTSRKAPAARKARAPARKKGTAAKKGAAPARKAPAKKGSAKKAPAKKAPAKKKGR